MILKFMLQILVQNILAIDITSFITYCKRPLLASSGISLKRVRRTNQIDEYLAWNTHMLSIRQKVTRNLSILKESNLS